MSHPLEQLYDQIKAAQITVLHSTFRTFKCVCIAEERMIAIDKQQLSGPEEEYTILIRQKGHFDSGAFYTIHSSPEEIRWAEERAERAAILQYIPLEKLRALLAKGKPDLAELAQDFHVTEAFMKNAVYFYKERFAVQF